jgi:hypothetical protein
MWDVETASKKKGKEWTTDTVRKAFVYLGSVKKNRSGRVSNTPAVPVFLILTRYNISFIICRSAYDPTYT